MATWIIIVCCIALFFLFRKKKPKVDIVPKSKPRSISPDGIMGKTTVVLRQMQSNADSERQVLKPIENPDTFAVDDENEVENEPIDISVPLEYETENPDDDFDEETEELHQATGGEANLASGASFEDLEHSYDVIRERKTSEEDERKAAETIRSESGTDIFNQMVAQVSQGVERVTSILDKHFPMQTEIVEPSNDKEFSDFDVASIL